MKQQLKSELPIGLIFKDGDKYICTDHFGIRLPKSIIDNIINETTDIEYELSSDEMWKQVESNYDKK